MDAPVPPDAARRVKAALTYRAIKRAEAAKKLNVGIETFHRMTGSKGSERKALTWDDLFAIAELCELPFEWFWADFDQLAKIAPNDRAPALVKHGRSTRTGPATARALKDRLRQEESDDEGQEEPGEQTG